MIHWFVDWLIVWGLFNWIKEWMIDSLVFMCDCVLAWFIDWVIGNDSVLPWWCLVIFLETTNYMIHLLEVGIKLFQIERYCSLITLEVFQNNSNSRCSIPSQEHDPWWRAELENRKYIYHVDVINSAESCDEGSSNTAITALVQQTISPPGVQCDSSKTYDARAKYTFRCGVTIPGKFVTLRLSGRSLNRLVLCSVDIRALGKWEGCWFSFIYGGKLEHSSDASTNVLLL